METKICVVGLGYVGLPLAVELSRHFPVIGFDVNRQRIGQLREGIDVSGEVEGEKLGGCLIDFTDDQGKIKEANFIIVCVPTPVDKVKKPDLSFLESASEVVGKNLGRGGIVVYESTVYPGCMEEVCVPILEKFSGLKFNEGFKVGYSPERMNPGDKEHTVDKVVKIVAGSDEESAERVASVYSQIVKAGVHRAPNIKTAEAAKVIENIQRDLNIALMNELAIIFDKLGIETKEVLEAAGTKWNFHKYYPGLVGGHCFDKSSTIFLINSGHQKIEQIGTYIDSLNCKKKVYKEGTLFYPEKVEVLSFDMVKKTTSFKPLTVASKRKVNEVFRITGAYNYILEVTDRHPVIIHDDELVIKFAKDIKVGDKLVLNKLLPSKKRRYTVDLLKHVNKDFIKNIRVKIKGEKLSKFRRIINKEIKERKGNYYIWDYLPLDKYLKIEKRLGIPRRNIFLCTGRGPSFKKFPCVFTITNDFIRLIGYYLSEGCITDDKSLRIRFTFHRDESEYIDDVTNILKKFNIAYSVYHDKTYKSTVIKVSSTLLGLLIRDVLCCGINCYNMQIPELFFDLNKKAKEELLKGLFRGDGGVTWYNGERTYKKNNKEYTHKYNSVEVNYFTSSSKLFQQVVLFLLNQGVVPKLAKRKGLLTLAGYTDVNRVKDWFLGDKKRKIDLYLQHQQKKTKYKKVKRHKDYIAINVEKIEKKKTSYVYSMEVADTHTLVTSNGIIAHNCIGVDPYYLTYKAMESGYHPEVILAGRRINDNMHKHLVDLIVRELNQAGKVLKESKVMLMGLSFKEDVKDYRNSKAREVINELGSYGIKVYGCDPLLGKEVVNGFFGVEYKEVKELEGVDGVVLVSPHSLFGEVDWKEVREKMSGNPLMVDLKGFLDKQEMEGLGFKYRGF